MENKEKVITEEYKEINTLANQQAEQDASLYPMTAKELKKHNDSIAHFKLNQAIEHRMDMLSMYRARYGDADERQRIIEYLEKNLTIYSDDQWEYVKAEILSGEYKNLTKENK